MAKKEKSTPTDLIEVDKALSDYNTFDLESNSKVIKLSSKVLTRTFKSEVS